jgi:hypothetical protein
LNSPGHRPYPAAPSRKEKLIVIGIAVAILAVLGLAVWRAVVMS